jgi:hypothetical protein
MAYAPVAKRSSITELVRRDAIAGLDDGRRPETTTSHRERADWDFIGIPAKTKDAEHVLLLGAGIGQTSHVTNPRTLSSKRKGLYNGENVTQKGQKATPSVGENRRRMAKVIPAR